MRFFLLVFLALPFGSLAQTIDLLRLDYYKRATKSEQTSLTVSNDGSKIAFSYKDKSIKILDARSGKVSKLLQGVHDDLFEIRFNQTGKKIVSVGDEKNVAVIDIASGKIEKRFDLPDKINRIAVSPTEDIMVFGVHGAQLLVYEFSDNIELVQKMTYKAHHVSAIDFSPDGKNIVACFMPSLRKKIAPIIYNVRTGLEQTKLEPNIYYSAKYSENGEEIFLGALTGMSKTRLFKYNTHTGAFDEAYKKTNWVSMTLYTSLIEQNGYLLSASIDQAFEVVDVKASEMVYSTKRDKNKLGQLYAKMGIDKTRIYPLAGGKNFLVNYSGDNVNTIYNTAQKKIIAFIYSDANQDLAVVARDGRLDGNIEAISNLYWSERKSNKQIQLESTFDKYYTPRLLPSLLSGENNMSAAVNIEDDIANIPVVSFLQTKGADAVRDPENGVTTFSTKQKNIDLMVQIDSFPEFATEVKLFHNGKLKAIQEVSGTNNYTFPVTLNNSFGSKNYFFAVATAQSGIESQKAKLIINYSADVEAKSKLYVLILGINNYKNPRYQLNYALSDAKSIEEIVRQGNSSLFDEIIVHTLYDNEVTKDKILAKFSELGAQMNEQDVFMFYYAGHGTLDKDDAANEFYIVPYDIVQLYGNSSMLKEKAISASEIRELSMKLNPQKQVFIIDACHSAGALESNLTRGAAEERAIAQLARSTGTFWLTAAGSEQFATEFEELGHGVFTYSLLEALTGENGSNGDNTLTIRELSSYVEMRVPELSEQYKGQAQYPASFSFGNDFPIRVLK